MPNDKIDCLTLPNANGVDTDDDIDLPTDATPDIQSLNAKGYVSISSKVKLVYDTTEDCVKFEFI